MISHAQLSELYRNIGKELPPEFGVDPAAPKKEKYGRIKKTVAGIEFDSSLEASAFSVLKLWESCGEITDLERQPKFMLQPKFKVDGKTVRAITYKADFMFKRSGRTVVLECKGFQTESFRLRAKLFKSRFPQLVFEIWDKDRVKELSRC